MIVGIYLSCIRFIFEKLFKHINNDCMSGQTNRKSNPM